MSYVIPPLLVSISGAGGSLTNPAQLSELRIQQRLGLPALCEISFSSMPAALEALAIGQTLEVAIQDPSEILFTGEISALEYLYPAASLPCLRLRAYDGLARLRMRQQVRAYVDCSLRSLLRELAGNNAELQGGNLDWPLLIQHQQNDLEFLAEQAALAGCYPLARAGRIYLMPLSGLNGLADVALAYGRNLYEARIEANTGSSCAAVAVYGWDTAQCSESQARETAARTGQEVDLQVSGLGERTLVNQGLDTAPHARALAQAELARRKAGEVTLWGRAMGSPDLQPGTPVWVSNINPAVAGRYILTAVTHSYDFTSGYTVEFSSEPPPAPQRSRCDVATLGVVTDINDPQRMGRVRVRLPAYADVETGWMGVVSPGAGEEKGFVTLPDRGDRVLVLLTREDPARGIVLGGLHAPKHPPGGGDPQDLAKRYTWTTRAGQRIHLSQDGHLVQIENGAGAQIEMKGNRIIISAGKIDFRRS